MPLTIDEKKFLQDNLLFELKKVKHYSVMKSRMLIIIAIKLQLDKVIIDNMKALFKEYYNNEFFT